MKEDLWAEAMFSRPLQERYVLDNQRFMKGIPGIKGNPGKGPESGEENKYRKQQVTQCLLG